ncbi:Crp/Fnr family transcriptional regulator [Chryseobacterium gwangjuense]|uniref:Crp/Fnr family transcriptional regulator n=1 Tax=Chryseobacterium gwangjuense TaxID=1069980 RepID=UPI001E36544B|nr:Crp/Fnr family transcriptional regulator [Chryseobacterium gwangjuense]MCE3076311.1 Crp/Fnr family transcriptional regulator [Chryseobacterium gwangjuense]
MQDHHQLSQIEIFKNLTNQELSALAAICTSLRLSKKEKLYEPGSHFDQLFVLKNGLMRWYFDNEVGTENNLFLPSEKEHALVGIPEFYEGHRTSKYHIEAVVDSEILLFDRQKFEELAFTHRGIYNLYIHSLKNVINVLRLRTEQLCTHSPDLRYEVFLKDRPFTTRNANRKYVASFLGITPNSLSRLTARIQKKQHPKK